MADVVIHSFQRDGKTWVWEDELFMALQKVENRDAINWSDLNKKSFNGRTAVECETVPCNGRRFVSK